MFSLATTSCHVVFTHLVCSCEGQQFQVQRGSDANQSFYSERDNLRCARRVTDSISTMFPLSCPMFRAVISLHQAPRSTPATPISRVTIYPTNN